MVSVPKIDPSFLHRKKRFFSFLFFCFVLTIITVNARFPLIHAAEEQDAQKEYVIKAYFLLNFSKYISWPENSFETDEAPFNVCILGRNPFGSGLDAFNGKHYKGHPFAVQFVNDPETIPECHILFVCKSMGEKLEDIIARTETRPILTVGEMEKFVNHGGIINLFIQEGKVRFEINKNAAEASSLQISSQLLKLAKLYEE